MSADGGGLSLGKSFRGTQNSRKARQLPALQRADDPAVRCPAESRGSVYVRSGYGQAGDRFGRYGADTEF